MTNLLYNLLTLILVLIPKNPQKVFLFLETFLIYPACFYRVLLYHLENFPYLLLRHNAIISFFDLLILVHIVQVLVALFCEWAQINHNISTMHHERLLEMETVVCSKQHVDQLVKSVGAKNIVQHPTPAKHITLLLRRRESQKEFVSQKE